VHKTLRIYVSLLIRVWRAPGTFDASNMLSWLHKRMAFNSGYSERYARELRAAMTEAHDRVRAITEYFVHTLVVDDNRWLKLVRFREAMLFVPSSDILVDIIVREMKASEQGSDRQLFFFEAGIALNYHDNLPHNRVIFEQLYSLGDANKFLREARDRSVVYMFPDGYFSQRPLRDVGTEGSRERQRQEFDQERERISAGEHLGWITHLGWIYFAQYYDVDRSLNPDFPDGLLYYCTL
jgi:hypothetical protein